MADTLPSDSVWADALAAIDAVPPPEMPECCVCMEMTLELTPCKHSLCSGCKDQINPGARQFKCPCCRAWIGRVLPRLQRPPPLTPEPPRRQWPLDRAWTDEEHEAYRQQTAAWIAWRDANREHFRSQRERYERARVARATRAAGAPRAPRARGPPPAVPDLRIWNAQGNRVDIPVDFWARLAANGIEPNYHRYASRSYAVRKALEIALLATMGSLTEGGRIIRITDASLVADITRISNARHRR